MTNHHATALPRDATTIVRGTSNRLRYTFIGIVFLDTIVGAGGLFVVQVLSKQLNVALVGLPLIAAAYTALIGWCLEMGVAIRARRLLIAGAVLFSVAMLGSAGAELLQMLIGRGP
jgi:hypothetical protein